MRFSIGKLMLLIAVCGLNFFLLSMIGRDPREYGVNQWFGELILLGGLPMVDFLAVLALSRRPGHWPTDRFLLAGCVALGLYLGIAALFPWTIRSLLIGLLEVVLPLGAPSLVTIVGRITLVLFVNLAFQVAIAAFLVRLVDRFSVRVTSPPESGPGTTA